MNKIEKLRQLLLEFDPYITKAWEHQDNIWYYAYMWNSAVFTKDIAESVLISKNYQFIEWLLELEAIDYDWFPQIEQYTDLESLLMYLSIQDKPIEFLASILK